jgi:hypothetical protein
MLSAALMSFVIAQASPVPAPQTIASPCPRDAEVAVATLVEPGSASLADETRSTGAVTGEVTVRVGSTGAIEGAEIYRSTTSMRLDQALLWASRRSTYSPKIANCRPVPGTYRYRFDFTPYHGDLAKETTRFTSFFNALLSTKSAPQDPSVRLDSNLTSADSLHIESIYYSSLGAFEKLQFLSDDFVQGIHRYHYTAIFDKRKIVVMFLLDRNDYLIGFINEG